LALLDQVASPATMAMAGPRFFGFVIGGAHPSALAADWMTSTWDQNTAFAAVTPATVTLERIALGWVIDMLGLPPSSWGAFVTGTTVAHMTALAAARTKVLNDAGWDSVADGLFGAPKVTVIVSDEAHPTLLKALGVVGLGRSTVERVPVDDQGRMRPDALPDWEGPAILCIQAGNVNTGAIDPLETLIAYGHERGAWVHVDGAFGLWAAAVPSLARLVESAAGADSWATDAHKWLNVPYDCGIALVRDPQTLSAVMSLHAEYLPEARSDDPGDYTPELSRRARGVPVWAVLRTLGREGLAALIEQHCRQARHFAEGLGAAGFEILNDVVLNQVLVSFGDADTTSRVIAAVQDDGTCWCGGTEWQGRTAMRISVSSWATTDEDVERSLEAIVRVAKRVSST
jgi:glutamate/tyrosine decarboxylase-like PLP-dependent enzyme